MTIERRMAEGYAGDVTPSEAWRVLSETKDAQLVDVRSAAEWTFVGVPDLSGLGKRAALAEWQKFPGMERSQDFVDHVTKKLGESGAGAETPVFFICRSGARSASAARAMTEKGFSSAYNVAGGFEGDLDEERHRGRSSGWKVDGLPWTQN